MVFWKKIDINLAFFLFLMKSDIKINIEINMILFDHIEK